MPKSRLLFLQQLRKSSLIANAQNRKNGIKHKQGFTLRPQSKPLFIANAAFIHQNTLPPLAAVLLKSSNKN